MREFDKTVLRDMVKRHGVGELAREMAAILVDESPVNPVSQRYAAMLRNVADRIDAERRAECLTLCETPSHQGCDY